MQVKWKGDIKLYRNSPSEDHTKSQKVCTFRPQVWVPLAIMCISQVVWTLPPKQRNQPELRPSETHHWSLQEHRHDLPEEKNTVASPMVARIPVPEDSQPLSAFLNIKIVTCNTVFLFSLFFNTMHRPLVMSCPQIESLMIGVSPRRLVWNQT